MKRKKSKPAPKPAKKPAKKPAAKAKPAKRKAKPQAKAFQDDAPPLRAGVTRFTRDAQTPVDVPEPEELPDVNPPASVETTTLEPKASVFGYTYPKPRTSSVKVTRQRPSLNALFY